MIMKKEGKIPFESKDLSEPTELVKKLSNEIIEEVKKLPIEKLQRVVLYTIATKEEIYHIEDEKRVLCYILKNAARAFGVEEDCVE